MQVSRRDSPRLGDADLEAFVQEVRRFYPLFPAVGGRVMQSFEWRGHGFSPGDWVLLDLHGTNHDPRVWHEPPSFQPERLRGRVPDADELIPQGGGNHSTGHRCLGESLTLALMKRAVRVLSRSMHYEVPTRPSSSSEPAADAAEQPIDNDQPTGNWLKRGRS